MAGTRFPPAWGSPSRARLYQIRSTRRENGPEAERRSSWASGIKRAKAQPARSHPSSAVANPRTRRSAKGQPHQSCNFAETAQLFRYAPQFSEKSTDFPSTAKGSGKRQASHQGFREHPKTGGKLGRSKMGKLRIVKRFMCSFPEIARVSRPAFREGRATPRKGGRRHGRSLARLRRKTRSGQRTYPRQRMRPRRKLHFAGDRPSPEAAPYRRQPLTETASCMKPSLTGGCALREAVLCGKATPPCARWRRRRMRGTAGGAWWGGS